MITPAAGRFQGAAIGERIGRCTLLRKLGEGGFAVVWLAEQEEPVRRQVALKTLAGLASTSTEARERFRIEAAAMAALDHPAILPVYEFSDGTTDHDLVPFLTMKFASGGTLVARRKELAGRWSDIARLMATVADAVHYAHEHGVLHRDLKPGNILFDESDRPYVSDFGMAKLLSNDSGLTRTTGNFGTPHYMAPELATGDLRSATTSSDLWALGVILYELLAGRRPFDADSVAVVLRRIVEEAPAPLPPEVPTALATITRKAMKGDPSHRYSSVREFGEDLQRWLDGKPVLARAATFPEQVSYWVRRHPELAALAVTSLVLMAITLASMAWALHSARREFVNVSKANEVAKEELRNSLLKQAESGRVARERGWRDAGLEAIRNAAAIRPGLDLRHEAIGHLAGYDIKFPSEADLSAEPHFHGVYAPDGVLHLYRESEPHPIATFPRVRVKDTLFVTLDPSGRWVVGHGAFGDVHLYRIADQRLVQSWLGARFHGFTANGEAFAVSLPGKSPCLFRTENQERIGEMPGNVQAFKAPGRLLAVTSPSAGQSTLAYADLESVGIRDWTSGQRVFRIPLIEPPVSLAWGGEWLAAGTASGDVRLIDLRRQQARTLAGHDNLVWVSLFDPAASVVVTSSYDGTALIWNTETGQLLLRCRDLYPRAFSADGKRVRLQTASGNGWGEFQRPGVIQLFSDRLVGGGDTEHDISPDGRLLAVCGYRGLEIFEISTGRMLLARPLDFGRSAHFTADGLHLILCGQTFLSLHSLKVENGRLTLAQISDLLPSGAKTLHTSYLSADRNWLGVAADGKRLGLLDCRDFTTWTWLPVNERPTTLIPSPGGRYAAGNHFNKGDGLRVWDVISGGESRRLGQGNSFARFSPDGRWLADGGTGLVRIFDATTWEVVHEEATGSATDLPNRVAWTPDGRMLAFPKKRHFVCLLDTASWQVVAELHDPFDSPISALCFGPDGRTLTVGRLLGGIGVWDISRLAEELAALGLPWELPARTPPAPTPPELGGDIAGGLLPALFPSR